MGVDGSDLSKSTSSLSRQTSTRDVTIVASRPNRASSS